jgi:hypothetical protein
MWRSKRRPWYAAAGGHGGYGDGALVTRKKKERIAFVGGTKWSAQVANRSRK